MPRALRIFASVLLLLPPLLVPAAPARAQERDPLVEAYERGMAAFEAGRFEEAVPHFERALALAQERLGPDDPDLATDLVNLGEVYRLVGRLDDAERLLRRALELDRRRADTHPERVAITLNNLGLLARARGRLDEAEAHYREALALLEKVHGPRHPDVAKVLSNLARVELARGRPDRSVALLRRAQAIVAASLEADHPTRRAVEANLERARSELALARARGTPAVEPAAGAAGGPARSAREPAPQRAGSAAAAKGQATARPVAADAPRGFAVHLASFADRERAEAAGEALLRRHRAALGRVRALPPAAVDVPHKGRFWRVLFGPYDSRAGAGTVCRRLREAGAWCAVVELTEASG